MPLLVSSLVKETTKESSPLSKKSLSSIEISAGEPTEWSNQSSASPIENSTSSTVAASTKKRYVEVESLNELLSLYANTLQ